MRPAVPGRARAGYVTAACDGGGSICVKRPARRAAGRSRWTRRGPRQVRVEFETADERSRVRVEAACLDGAPAFEVDDRTKG